MKIKRYLVRSMPEAMNHIRNDLGPDAVIISTRRVREKGWRGLFLPSRFEVTAALDDGGQKPVGQDSDLRVQFEEIKGLLQRVIGRLGRGGNPAEDGLANLRQLLLRLELNAEVIEDLLAGIEGNPGAGAVTDDGSLREELVAGLERLLAPAWPGKPLGRVRAFVGPTGVGKTTTLAKLAARLSLFEHKKIALISIDTYRIGAVEQLNIYGEILGVPVEVALSPQDLRHKVEAFRDKDVVLIDTTGRSPRNGLCRGEVRAFLRSLEDVDSYLVLSCTTKSHDLEAIAAGYAELEPSRFIFTKLDETEYLGGMVNVVTSTRLPVAYVTNGQNVPDDIQEVCPEKLARLVLGAGENG